MTFFGFPLQIESPEAFTVECMFPSCARDCHSFKRKSHSAIYMLNVYAWEAVNITMHCSLIAVKKKKKKKKKLTQSPVGFVYSHGVCKEDIKMKVNIQSPIPTSLLIFTTWINLRIVINTNTCHITCFFYLFRLILLFCFTTAFSLDAECAVALFSWVVSCSCSSTWSLAIAPCSSIYYYSDTYCIRSPAHTVQL